ncbi:YgiW/YdeI family stress tolerance OB fold protein [Saezia sanguinis]|uniref:YgiW/YdeI family stress tolerance OB fold protein n=1 Tax=Saezia sanguinis TaxID=1965230 RepID=UPI00304A2F9E
MLKNSVVQSQSGKRVQPGVRKYGFIMALVASLAMLVPAADVMANEVNRVNNVGGFSGPGPDLVTVQQALAMRDDARVSLQGSITRSLGDETYMFVDATGSIEVEIDHRVWRGQQITPQDVVVISGEVDREWNHVSIDVSSVVKP